MAAVDTVFFFMGNVVFLILNLNHPGILLVSMILVFFGIAITICAKSMSHLVDNVAELQENSKVISKANMISVCECRIDIVRYATADGEIVLDSETHKYITYTAYEDRDLSSRAGTLVDLTTRECTYSDTQEYFEDVDLQIKNVRDMGG